MCSGCSTSCRTSRDRAVEGLVNAEGVFAVIGPYVFAFCLALTRVSAMFTTTPLFNSPTVPRSIKAGLVGILPVFVMITTDPTGPDVKLDAFTILGAIVIEAIVGGIMGLGILVLFAAVQFTGQLIGIQMGFAIANVVDPTTFQQVGVLSQFLNLLGLMLFISMDGHLLVLQALFESTQLIPLGTGNPNGSLIIGELVRYGSKIFSMGLRIGLPVVCVVLLVNVGLATLARTVPQVNIFILGFLITISIGVLILGLALPSTAVVFGRFLEEALFDIVGMLRFF